MKFDELIDNIIDTCINIGIKPLKLSANDELCYQLAGVNCKSVPGGTVLDIINIDRDFPGKNGAIEIIVNGESYELVYDVTTGDTVYSKAKLSIEETFNDLVKTEIKDSSEQTFNRALHKFIIRNN